MARAPVAHDRRLAKFAAAPATDPLYNEQATDRVFRWLTKLPDPDDTLRKLGRGRYTLRALEYDDEISQCLDTRRDAVLATPWRLEPQDAPESALIGGILKPHLDELVRGAFEAVAYGYSVIEVVYAQVGREVGIDRLSAKPLEWFAPWGDGTLRYFPNDGSAGTEGVVVDPRKFLLTRRQPSYRNPYGEPLLSRLYWPFYFRTQGRRFWAQFLERFGFPILVGAVSDGQAFVDAMTKLGIVSPIAVPPGSTVNAVTSGQAGEFEKFDSAFSRTVQKVILGQTLTSDVGGTGSYAAAKIHDLVRKDKRDADIRLISATVQQLVNTLAELNGLSTPEFVMAEDASLTFDQVTRLIELKAISPTPQLLQDWGLKDGDYALTTGAGAPTQPSDAVTATLAAFAPPRFTPEQQVIEDGVASALTKLGSVIADGEIKAAIRLAQTPQELHESLARLLADAEPGEFQRVFERALFAADIVGYAHASAGGAA